MKKAIPVHKKYMIIGVMQPYFFPYLGYFDLIFNSERWIVFDSVQYIRHGWVNRNRVLHPTSGWQYIVVPLQKHSMCTLINQVLICEDSKWKEQILRQLHHYRKEAPFYKQTISLVEECLAYKTSYLYKLNISVFEKVCAFLGIPFNYSIFSEMNLDLGTIEKTVDWALKIPKAVGAATLINPPGGRDLYDPKEFREHGIELIIRDFPMMAYSTGPYVFEPNLSIIDVLMWNSPERIRAYLDREKLPI